MWIWTECGYECRMQIWTECGYDNRMWIWTQLNRIVMLNRMWIWMWNRMWIWSSREYNSSHAKLCGNKMSVEGCFLYGHVLTSGDKSSAESLRRLALIWIPIVTIAKYLHLRQVLKNTAILGCASTYYFNHSHSIRWRLATHLQLTGDVGNHWSLI